MTPIEKLIEAAKYVLMQQTMNRPGIDELSDAVKAVESAKPGNRLELVEITEEDVPKKDFDIVYAKCGSGIFRIYRKNGKWTLDGWFNTAPIPNDVTFDKFYRLAHPAEMSEPMVPFSEVKEYLSGENWEKVMIAWTNKGLLNWEDYGDSYEPDEDNSCSLSYDCECKLALSAIRAQLASKTPADPDPDAGKWVNYCKANGTWQGRSGLAVKELSNATIFEHDHHVNSFSWKMIPLSEARKIEAERLKKSDPHAGMIQIGNGDWVDPKSDTTVYKMFDDLSDIYSKPAHWYQYSSPKTNYFLSRSNAEAFLKSERLKAGWAEINGEWVKPDDVITIGNGAKVKKGTTGLWMAINGSPHNRGIKRFGDNREFDGIHPEWPDLDRIYLTEEAAKQRLRDDGLFETADGKWVSGSSTVYTINQNTSLVASFPSYAIDNKFSFYFSPEAAAAAWLKLVEGGEK